MTELSPEMMVQVEAWNKELAAVYKNAYEAGERAQLQRDAELLTRLTLLEMLERADRAYWKLIDTTQDLRQITEARLLARDALDMIDIAATRAEHVATEGQAKK